jgi:predicted RNA-binding Zn ribbon-like protein
MTQPCRGDVETLRRFINTADHSSGEEALTSPGNLRDWMAAEGLAGPGDPAGDDDLATALELREALRALAFANNEAAADPDAIATVNRIAAGLPVAVRLTDGGETRLQPQQGGVAGGLSRLLATVHEAILGGSWVRLKACRNDECRWAFYDTSRNRSKRWCTMEECGNVVNARAYRSRKRAARGK